MSDSIVATIIAVPLKVLLFLVEFAVSYALCYVPILVIVLIAVGPKYIVQSFKKFLEKVHNRERRCSTMDQTKLISRLKKALAGSLAVLILGCSSLGYLLYQKTEECAAEWEAGYAQGKEAGYDVGYDAGKTFGYDSGYEDGLAAGIAQDEEDEETTYSTAIDPDDYVVYITDTGSKYHERYCGSLWNSCHEITLSQAIASGYGACYNCSPPVG